VQDLHKALADINAIRVQVARGTQFRGYGPKSIAAGGVLALLVASLQSLLGYRAEHNGSTFLTVWIAVAILAAVLAACETTVRSQRIHLNLSRAMMQSALEQFLPSLVVGLLLTVVLERTVPEEIWMLPGLWEVSFSLGIFASCRLLPRPFFAVGLWYLVCGLTCFTLESESRLLSPWAMGIPFGVGQLMVAAVLQYDYASSVQDAG
jgi:hypothetical protein